MGEFAASFSRMAIWVPISSMAAASLRSSSGAPAGELLVAQLFDDFAGLGRGEKFDSRGGECFLHRRDFLHGQGDGDVQVAHKAFLVGDILHVERADEFVAGEGFCFRGRCGFGHREFGAGGIAPAAG